MTTKPAVEIDLDAAQLEPLLKSWFGLEDCTGLFNPARMLAFTKAAIAQARASQAVAEPVAEWVNWEQGFQHLRAEGLPDGTQLYAAPVAQQSKALTCTCPSGDGSLRWPCPKHPPEAIQPVEAGAPTAAAEMPKRPQAHMLAGKNLDSLHVLYTSGQMDEYGKACFVAGRESAAPVAKQDAQRLEIFIDWYLREGKRAEIHPHGHMERMTREHILAWLDRAAMQKGAQDEN